MSGTIVYYATERVADLLKGKCYAIDHYHAGLKSEVTLETQQKLTDSDRHIIVATNAFPAPIRNAHNRR